MSNESRIEQLLEEILDSKRTPEEVCADSPELLWEVRERWERCQDVEAQIEALFPTTGSVCDVKRKLHLPTTLPVIPGYQIEAILGRGGMGIVYKARHLKLNRAVAIKMLLCGELAASEELTCLMREAQAVAGLRHPHIVQVHDIGDLDGLPYFTMEFVEGGSLAQKLAGVPQPARDAAKMLVMLAGAVQAAHAGGLVHRDLKPSNILLTSDGTPKITDFGLARRLEADAPPTMRGAKVGTPSYMAPEQALGKVGAFCPSVDIYSLGAILYEMLTGRPPFKAETASETQRQLISEEPVQPSRLNSKVPCDLQTICLKCLRKESDRRYANAAALAEDLGRFLRGEPVTARPTTLLERAAKWVRRRPGLATMLAASVLLAVVLLGSLQRSAVHQASRRQAVEADLKQIADLQHRARWSDARAVLERAEARLHGVGPGELRPRIAQARRDLVLAMRLDSIRLGRLTNGELPFYKAQADRDYAGAFRAAELGEVHDDVNAVAGRIRASAAGTALVAALDDWAVCATDKNQRRWLLEVAKIADPDPSGWRQRIRNYETWEDPAALAELVADVPIVAQPVSLLLAVGERLRSAGGDAPTFLRRVQKEHPGDFWANLILGDALVAHAAVEAAGYYRAALASRPGAAVGYTSVGDALNQQNMRAEAIAYYRKSVEIDPSYARGHTNLGNILKASGQIEEAIKCYRKALEVDPHYAWAHYDLANTLDGAGRLEEAIEHYRRFHEVDPTNSYITNILRADMARQGRGEEALRQWQQALQADPPAHEPYFGYAEMCLFLGHQDQYRRARTDLLRRFGDSTDPFIAEKVARACLLLPGTDEEVQMAAALAQRAVAASSTTPQWIYRYFKFAEGLAEFRQENFDSAISIMRSQAGAVMGPAPRLVIAMAQHRKGETAEGRKTLAAAIARFDWSQRHADRRDHFIMHILRREAEAMILPDLPAFLDGTYQPTDNLERLTLLGVCRFKNLHGTSAQLYADAFAADPKLVEAPLLNPRYNAACAAALAGSGLGEDAAELTELQRARWRKQARQWLEEELVASQKRLEDASPPQRDRLQKTLKQWEGNPDFAGLRDPIALARLSPEEREECLALWKKVAQITQPATPS